MAPHNSSGSRRRAGRPRGTASAHERRVAAFLKDFDREVAARLAQVEAEGEALKREVENLSNVEVLRLPVALREMNWLEFHAMGGSQKALESLASSELDIAMITQLATKAVQTPFRTAKKAKQDIETIDEEAEASLLPVGKKSRQESQVDPEGAGQKSGKAQTSSKKLAASKRTRPPSSRSKHFQNSRPSKANPTTPVGQGHPAKAGTPLFTSAGKFDSSVFKTPGLRAPAPHERVFSISANGSPLANRGDVFLTLPVGTGECIRIEASEILERDLRGLDEQALGSVKKLSSQLAQLCSRVGRPK